MRHTKRSQSSKGVETGSKSDDISFAPSNSVGPLQENRDLARRNFLKKTVALGGVAGVMSLAGAGLIRSSDAATSTDFVWQDDPEGNFGLYDPTSTEILSITPQGLLTFFYPSSSSGTGSDIRVNFSNTLFGSGIPRIAFAMKWARVTSSQTVSIVSPHGWDVVYLMVGHLKITGYSGTSPVTFTVNYTDPPGDNFTANLCSVTPTQTIQNTDFTPVCEDIGRGATITISVNLGAGDTVENMQGYLTFLEVDRRPGNRFNNSVPAGMDTGDANQQLLGFSTGAWHGHLS